MMTWRTISIPGAILLLAFILSIQGADADPPYVKDGAPIEVTFDEDETFSGLNLYDIFADDDPEDARLNLTYHQVEHLTISIAWVTGAVTILPNVNFYGQVNVVFIATDTNGSSVTHGLTVNILPVNDPPIIKKYIQKQSLLEEEAVTIDLEDYNGGPVFEDIEGKALTYRYSSDGDILVSVNGSVVIFTGAIDFAGFVTDLVIWAEDDLGARSENMTLAFEVRNNGHPLPSVTRFEPNSTSVTIEELTTISFRILKVSEIELEEWTFNWYVDFKEVVNNHSSVMWFPDFSTIDQAYNTSGVYKVSVRLHHREGDWEITTSGPQWTLTVLDVNRPPGVTMITDDQEVSQGDRRYLQVLGYDEDGDDLTYRWFHSRDAVTFEEVGTGDRLLYQGDLGPGKHYFRCEVSDGKDNTTSDWVRLTNEPESPDPTDMMPTMVILTVAISLFALLMRHRSKQHSHPDE